MRERVQRIGLGKRPLAGGRRSIGAFGAGEGPLPYGRGSVKFAWLSEFAWLSGVVRSGGNAWLSEFAWLGVVAGFGGGGVVIV